MCKMCLDKPSKKKCAIYFCLHTTLAENVEFMTSCRSIKLNSRSAVKEYRGFLFLDVNVNYAQVPTFTGLQYAERTYGRFTLF